MSTHPPSLPRLTAATKADQYARLRRIDRHTLRRQKAHCRNALKMTEGVAAAQRRLDDLKRLSREGQSSIERVSVCSEVFQEVIGGTGIFSPLLMRIKASYDQHLQTVLRRVNTSGLEDSRLPRPGQGRGEGTSPEVPQLRKNLHALEVQCRVTLQQNKRLREELSRERELHRTEVEQLKSPVEEPESRIASSHSFSSRLENLQQQLVEEREAIAREASLRTACVPITVCRQLEQCLRETEIELQKLQKRNRSLEQKLQVQEGQLTKELKALNTTEDTTRKLWKALQEGLTFSRS